MLVDIRSDTVTKPTAGMLDAMMSAKVGDDVYGEDPTVNELERKAAELFNTEAAVFCVSGTMSNQIAAKMLTNPGDEVILGRTSHLYNFESGGAAFNSGVSMRCIEGDRGRLNPQHILDNINPPDDHYARTSMVAIENTCNKGGGCYYSLSEMKAMSKVCRENNLKIHLDGARIFNALTATGDQPRELGHLFDSISFCLSKGLGAPVGSLLLGSKVFIKESRRVRKKFGGSMRQAGYLAAAGIYALDNNVIRLKEDHRRAKILGDVLKTLSCVEEVVQVDSNIVVFKLTDKYTPRSFMDSMLRYDIKGVPFGPQHCRFVTHLDFNDEMLEYVSASLKAMDN